MSDGARLAVVVEHVAEQGLALVEELRAKALAEALSRVPHDAIVSAHTMTALGCCYGAGYIVTFQWGRVAVALCPCVRVQIVTRLPE